MWHPVPVEESPLLRYAAPRPPAHALAMCEIDDALSPLQQHTVRLAMDALVREGVFGLGDGTGVGKARVIAALALEWSLVGRGCVLWITANNVLALEAARELHAVRFADQVPLARVRFGTYASTLHERAFRLHVEHLNGCASVPLVVFDECHLLRNQGTLFGRTSELINETNLLHRPAIVYSSATMMSSPKHVLYLDRRFGLHTVAGAPFATFAELSDALERTGPALMELVAHDLCSRGLYVSRQLTMRDVRVDLQTVHLNAEKLREHDALVRAHDGAATLTFHSHMHLFVLQSKLDAAFQVADAALESGERVIFVLMRTGEASLEDAPPARAHPMDVILHRYGGAPRVAEISGRRRRWERHGESWRLRTVSRRHEVAKFCDSPASTCPVAILTRAGGTGLSLHDAVGNQRRCTIVLDLPWGAEDLVQIVGRTHRAAQASVPRFVVMTCNLPLELRVASALTKRLRHMGALARGDQTMCDPIDLCRELTDDRVPAKACRILVCKLFVHRHDVARENIQAHLASESWVRFGARVAASAWTREDVERTLYWTHLAGALASHGSQWRAWVRSVAPFCAAGCVRWTPEHHRIFSRHERDVAHTVMLCAHRLSNAASLGCIPPLPRELWLHIVDLVLWEGDDLARVHSAWGTAQMLRFARIQHPTVDDVHNVLMRFPHATQAAMLRLLRTCTSQAVRRPARRRVVEPVEVRTLAAQAAGVPVSTSIVDVTFVSTSDVEVTIDYKVDDLTLPPENASFVRNVTTREIAWSHPGASDAYVTIHGREVTVEDGRWSAATRSDWDAARVRRARFLSRRCSQLPKTMRVAVGSVLSRWRDVQRGVVLVPWQDRVLVGVLMDSR